MYYICEWHNNYIIFNSTTNELSVMSTTTIEDAIKAHKENRWNTLAQPERDIHIENNILYDKTNRHSVYCSLESIDIDIKKEYPELFI